MKKFKRALAAVLAAVSLMTLLAGCGKFTCDICGDESGGRKYKGEVLGMEVVYCKDCHDGLEELKDLFN